MIYSHDYAANFIDDLQSMVTEYMKLSSYSVGISDLLQIIKQTQQNGCYHG